MYPLYFENSQGQRRVLTSCNNLDEVFDAIKKFLDEHNFKSYYYRTHVVDGEVQIDVGSWSEFFYIDKKVFETSEQPHP